MGVFGAILGKVDSALEFIDDFHDELHKSDEVNMNDAEQHRRSDMVEAELEYRIKSCIRQLKERDGDEDLIERLSIRADHGIYEYEDLLIKYGYDPESFDIKKERIGDIWDPRKHYVREGRV